MPDYYNTLVLSGGSVKCISQLGCIQYCYDNNLIQGVKTFIGASAGALLAYLLSIGYTPTEVMVYICTHDLFPETQYLDIMSMMKGGGVMGFSKVQDHLERMTIEKIGRLVTFREIKEHLGNTLVMSTYNWNKQKTEFLSHSTTPDEPCLIAVRKSCALPFVFPPFKYMGDYYIDGGICDNFPITYEVEGESDSKSRRLGIILDFYSDENVKDPPDESVLEYIYKIITIPTRQNAMNTLESAKHIDIIKIKNDSSMFNFHMSIKERMELFSEGYRQAREYFNPKMQCSLPPANLPTDDTEVQHD